MNRIYPKDLKVGQLCWHLQYMGDSMPQSQDLVVITQLPDGSSNRRLMARVISTGLIFEPSQSYAQFEEVHPQYLENKIKALEAEQIRIAAELAAMKSL
jgi:hypothetical protein